MHLRTLFFLLVSLLIVSCSALAAEGVDYDTTRVRQVEPVKKSTLNTIADIPGEFFKLPIYAIEYSARLVVKIPPFAQLPKLINLGGPALPYTPVIGYSTRVGYKAGLKVKLSNVPDADSRLKLKWYYSSHDYQLYQLRYTSPHLLSSSIGLDLDIQYRMRTRDSFYGIGMLTNISNEVNYTKEETEFRGSLPIRLGRGTLLSLNTRYLITNLFDGRDPDHEGSLAAIRLDPLFAIVPGQMTAMRHFDIGFSFEHDRRNNIGRPTRGSHLLAEYERLYGVDRSADRDYETYSVDFRSYFAFWRDRVLAMRVHFSGINATGSDRQPVPFYLSGNLGGIDGLRGYSRGRFVDDDLVLISFEYRYPIYDYFDAFLFLDEGRVYSDILNEWLLDDWRHSFGFGFRLFGADNVKAMAQIARSDESTRFYAELGATW